MKLLDSNQIKKTIELLLQDKIVIIPTDTIYGISAKISENNRIKINKLKRSDINKQLIILISSIEQGLELIAKNKEVIDHLENDISTTIIYYSKDDINKKIAIRLIKRPDLFEIIEKTGPIYSTSVNYNKQIFLKTKEELLAFNEQIEEVFFSEELNNPPSKIVDLTNNTRKR